MSDERKSALVFGAVDEAKDKVAQLGEEPETRGRKPKKEKDKLTERIYVYLTKDEINNLGKRIGREAYSSAGRRIICEYIALPEAKQVLKGELLETQFNGQVQLYRYKDNDYYVINNDQVVIKEKAK